MNNMLKARTLEDERVIGYNVFRIMNEKNITEEQLSNLIDTSEMRIRAIITGSVDVQEEELDSFADGLGVTKQELLQSVPDENLYCHNIHYMGTATCAKDMKQIMDKADMYVRLLYARSDS